MRVLHLINTLSAGGAELHLLTLCKGMRRQGIEPEVACLREHVAGSRTLRQAFVDAGVPVHDLEASGRWNVAFVRRLAALVARTKPDVLHTHLPRADLAAACVRLYRPVPWVASVHYQYSNDWYGSAVAPLLAWSYRRADAVIAISHAIGDWLRRDLRLSGTGIETIHYGIDIGAFRVAPIVDLRSVWGIGSGPLIGSMGRLESRKGFECLIRAMERVLRRVPDARLVIAGHDPYGLGPRLQALIDEVDVRRAVHLLGFVADVPSFFRTIDLFAFASLAEGFGQVTVEAMAAGTPVVVSAIPPMTEIVTDPATGRLADPTSPEQFAEAMVAALRDPDETRRRAAAAVRRVEESFSVDAMTHRTIDVYERTTAATQHDRRSVA